MSRRRTNDQQPLLIDRAAAAEVPSVDAIAEWARDKRVFISSVMTDLADERRAAASAIRVIGATPVMFETLGGRDADAEGAYLGEVETSHIYLGILGRRYGKPLPNRYSATHWEYRHAETSRSRIAVWTRTGNDREGPQQSFLEEVRVFHTVPSFTNPEDLAQQIELRLRTIAAEDLAPWSKLGHIIFRATEVTHNRERIRVQAKVQSDDVAHLIEELAPGPYGGSDAMRVSWAGRSKYVRVNSVECTTTSARAKLIRLDMEIVEAPRNNLLEMSVSGFTTDDLTEGALRTVLFGERNILDGRHLESMAEMPDPIQPLRQANVPDEIVRPLAELLIVDELVGSGRAVRVPNFRLGTSVSGMRQLEMSWDPPPRYSSELPQRRTIHGQIRL
jgi:hypothetical protein